MFHVHVVQWEYAYSTEGTPDRRHAVIVRMRHGNKSSNLCHAQHSSTVNAMCAMQLNTSAQARVCAMPDVQHLQHGMTSLVTVVLSVDQLVVRIGG
jgi:hypothetical protein